jgi:hypothetical protein
VSDERHPAGVDGAHGRTRIVLGGAPRMSDYKKAANWMAREVREPPRGGVSRAGYPGRDDGMVLTGGPDGEAARTDRRLEVTTHKIEAEIVSIAT